MTIHYKQTILEQIDLAIETAKKENKKIQQISLNEKEWGEFVGLLIRLPFCNEEISMMDLYNKYRDTKIVRE